MQTSEATLERVAVRTAPPMSLDFSEVGLTSPAFDRDRGELPRRKYAILSSPRSGSFLLCRLLTRLGLGVPHEYYNIIHYKALSWRWDVGPEDYYEELLRRRTVNDVFGAKIQWQQMCDLCDIPSGELCSEYRIIYLYRRRLKRQAASLHYARFTGQWDLGETVTTPRCTDKELFDPAGVKEALDILIEEEIGFRRFFACHDVWPLFVAYEDLVEHRESTLRTILDYIGIDPRGLDLTVPGEPGKPPPNAKQAEQKRILASFLADVRTEEWDGRRSDAFRRPGMGERLLRMGRSAMGRAGIF